MCLKELKAGLVYDFVSRTNSLFWVACVVGLERRTFLSNHEKQGIHFGEVWVSILVNEVLILLHMYICLHIIY